MSCLPNGLEKVPRQKKAEEMSRWWGGVSSACNNTNDDYALTPIDEELSTCRVSRSSIILTNSRNELLLFKEEVGNCNVPSNIWTIRLGKVV